MSLRPLQYHLLFDIINITFVFSRQINIVIGTKTIIPNLQKRLITAIQNRCLKFIIGMHYEIQKKLPYQHPTISKSARKIGTLKFKKKKKVLNITNFK